ncbi:spore coat protein YlbD [Terrilactibacillus laevilacticus]|uniref:Spore coat protein YlbD n=1 Tax=Terrilactibacillus laevilacticus TaxID=1380157 RepID=A0ABW5PQ43_9BACI|nr:spore coat protein YlbD [Terrilactibacillus laevilacticus]
MSEQRTNDAIHAFKTFLRKHPEMVKKIKEQGKSWNDIFDEWVLFGEDSEIWDEYGIKRKEVKKDTGTHKNFSFDKVISFINHIDTKNWENRLETLNGALTSIQGIIGQFQPQQKNNNQQNGTSANENRQTMTEIRPQNPFHFRRD